jgi:hypothetical protein
MSASLSSPPMDMSAELLIRTAVVPRTLVFRESPQEYKCGLLFHQVYEK